MRKPPFKRPRTVFALWGVLLAASCVLAVGANFTLAGHVQRLRAADPRTYLAEAERRIGRDDLDGAFEQIDQAIARAPSYAEAYRMRGLLLFRQKRFKEAFDAFQQAIDRGSRDEDMRIKAMNALMQMKQTRKALAFGKKCISEGYRYPTFPRYMAELSRTLGRPGDAAKYYEEALKGYPNDLFLMARLAQAYRTIGVPKKAEELERRITEAQTQQEEPPAQEPETP